MTDPTGQALPRHPLLYDWPSWAPSLPSARAAAQSTSLTVVNSAIEDEVVRDAANRIVVLSGLPTAGRVNRHRERKLSGNAKSIWAGFLRDPAREIYDQMMTKMIGAK